MQKVKDESYPLVDITPPVIKAPQAGQAYYSPVHTDVKVGEGGHYAAKTLDIHFHPNGPFRDKVDRYEAEYSQELSPGPNQLHSRGHWYSGSQNEESDWTRTDWFYVLTPPKGK